MLAPLRQGWIPRLRRNHGFRSPGEAKRKSEYSRSANFKVDLTYFDWVTMRDRIDQWIEIKCRQIRIFGLDVNHIWRVIPANRFKFLSIAKSNIVLIFNWSRNKWKLSVVPSRLFEFLNIKNNIPMDHANRWTFQPITLVVIRIPILGFVCSTIFCSNCSVQRVFVRKNNFQNGSTQR